MLNLSFVPSLRTPPRSAGVQAQVSDEGGQGRWEGQDQGAGRLGGAVGAQADRVKTWEVGARLEAAAKPGQSQVGSASWVRVTCIVVGDQQNT